MKINILHSKKSEPDEGCAFDIDSTTVFNKNKVHLLSLIIGMFLFCLPFATFAQEDQLDLRDNPAYEAGKCPANDIRVISATLSTGSPCFTCNEGEVTVPLTIRINHNTESHDRHLAICANIVETLPNGGGTVNHPISKCFGPLLTNSEQIGGGQDLESFDFTFTCGSTLVITDILLVWTAANGECPVTLANNPNGKYCWDNPDVIIPTQIMLTEEHVNAGCFGSATGSINLSVSGGVPPYTYAWTVNPGGPIPAGQADDQDLVNIPAGTYSVTVTDSKGCSATKPGIVITQNAETFPDIAKASASATTQCGVSPATAQAAINTAFAAWLANATPNDPNDVESNGVVVVNGGASPYSVVITNPASPAVPQAPLYTGGVTSVTWRITDNCGKQDTVTATFTVNNPCNILCETVPTHVPCFGGSTGSILARGLNGFPPYTFRLYLASDLNNVLATLTDNTAPLNPGEVTFTGLAAGTYTIVITDQVQTTVQTGTICDNVTINQPAAALSSTISDVDVLCFGGATGSINLTPSGGTPPYTYAWTASNGGVIPAGQADDQDLSGLVAGTYSVVITDANGTTGGCRATNSAVISQPAAALSSTISDVDVLCFGAATGSINLTPSGGTPPYTYAWTASNGGVIPAGQADDQDLSGLVAGTYSVVITDANGTTGGCRATNSAVISQPTTGLTSTISDVDVLCFGGATGSINLTPSGGTPPYAYAWTASNGGVIPAGQADDQDLSGLVAGTYSVVITDASGSTGGCLSQNSAVISQPAAALSSTISDVDVLCYGGATGSINLTPSGGTPPYTYAWTASNGGVIPAGQADDQDLSGLVAGTYSVVITDANGTTGGCRATNSAVITQPAAALSSTISDVDVLCNGAATGSINLTPSGGTPPYAYAWTASNGGVIPAGQADDQDLSGLVAGTYSVVITDANGTTGGCRATNSAVISQPSALSCSITKVADENCAGQLNGSATVNVTGGTGPFTYAWDNNETTATATGLGAGLHTITVTDANRCTTTCNITILSVPCNDANCTYTQGYYGAYNGVACEPDGDRTTDYEIMRTALGYHTVTTADDFYNFGVVANNRYFKLNLSDVISNPIIADNNIYKMMPGGGPAQALGFLVGGSTYSNVGTWWVVPIKTGKGATYGKIGNVLLSQTMALFFNKSLDSQLGSVQLTANMATVDVACGSDTPIPDTMHTFSIPQSVITYLTGHGGATVNNLFTLANQVLGGVAGLPSPSEVNQAVSAINEGFDGCRLLVTAPQGIASDNTGSTTLGSVFSAYPVPFKDHINVRYEFDYHSKARIEVYDAKGIFVMAYDDADAYFNKEVRLDVNFNQGEGQLFFIKVITDQEVGTKRIISKK